MAQQTALAFLENQLAHIEPEVYMTRYPDIQYPSLVPVDTSAGDWARSVIHYSTDRVGQADWFAADGQDIPLADVTRDQHSVGVHMGAIGYGYNLQEVEQARMANVMLTSERAMAARRAAEEYIDHIVLNGSAEHGWEGLTNHTGSGNITRMDASGTGAGRAWLNESSGQTKTPDMIISDVNALLTGIYSGTLQVEMADTLLMPVAAYAALASRRLPDTAQTVMEFIQRSNIYTATTGQQLMIRAVRGTEGIQVAGDNDTRGRVIAYRRDPQVLRLHLPMPHRFLGVYQTGPISWTVPGIFRLGGLEIRRPGSMRYMDGVLSTA